MADYDINSAFKAIEEELIASMIRNMEHHIDIEKSENMTYPQWQAEQLKALQEYRINNRHNFNRGTPNIRKQIEKAIRQAYKNGRTMQEAEILKAIKNGFVPPHKPSAAAQAEFFKINERKLNALIKSVTDDIVKANHATLRMANDQYRKTLFNAQVYFNAGTGNLRQAVDMAARDFLAKGINCVEYKNGRRVSAATYAQMALRTANTRAYLCGEAQMRDEWGISTVIVNKRGAACPLCMKWVGRVYYDDVWGHTNITDSKYPRLSTAISGGLYHPNCKDGHTTYFEGVSTPPAEPTKQDIIQANDMSRAEARANYAARQVEKYRRLSEYSLDDDNKAKYRQRLSEWQKQAEIAENNVANDGNSGIIEVERDKFRSKADPMFEVTGSAYESNPEEIEKFKKEIIDNGCEFVESESERLAYAPGRRLGEPGQVIVSRNASYSAWCHEIQHMRDDKNSGWQCARLIWDNDSRYEMEKKAYKIEMNLAKQLGRDDIVKRLQENLEEERRLIYGEE